VWRRRLGWTSSKGHITDSVFAAAAGDAVGASRKTGETFGPFMTITPPTGFTTGLGPIATFY